MTPESLMSVSIFIIDAEKIIETPEGKNILPPPRTFRNVLYSAKYLVEMCQLMREAEMSQDDPVVFRTFNESDPESPIFASAIVSPAHYQITPYTTGGNN